MKKFELEQHRSNIMKRVLFEKFTQHPELQTKLLATGCCNIIFESDTEHFWGKPTNEDDYFGGHCNELGRLLMKLRAQLRQPNESQSTRCKVCHTPFPEGQLKLHGWTLVCPDCFENNDLRFERIEALWNETEPVHSDDSDSDMGF